MGRECELCGEWIPIRVTIDGKMRSFQHRKQCFGCRPYRPQATRTKQPMAMTQRAKDLRKERKRQLVEYCGGCCCVCGYDRHMALIDFHHVDPKTKLFGISQMGTLKSWDRLVAEVDKCVPACRRCHGEIHLGEHQEAMNESLRRRRTAVCTPG